MKKALGLPGFVAFMSIFVLGACEHSKPSDHKVTTCIPASEMDGIIGGARVNSNDILAKKVVMLLTKKGKEVSICTGTPISKDVILTAAHCVDGAEKTDVAVVFHTDVTCESGFNSDKQAIKVQDFISHSGYSRKADATNDLALVKMNSSIPSDYEISEIYDGTSELSTDQVTLAGYGITDEDGKGAMFLRTTTKSFKNDITVEKENIVMEQKHTGVCSGDSGGPVFVEVGGKLKIAGVNSVVSGKKEAICHGKSVSMFVPYFIDWIQTQSANLN